ncbi:hypothetical protein BDF20DRAFT_23290 [Mycotypha africana]|uniref:uncharacterized protein n=1 Tax=Mycotypha africana TaxID=64632 RepID=UPI00230154CC|nr:uncharacterized protein BDF20DRAFT_23290 [Mycotypha africana]KAI8991115.1 hypothetical protein BDF20DRAFT_23290 [Mycotypha africana]
MEICKHQVQYNGLCAVCGTLLETLDDPSGVFSAAGGGVSGGGGSGGGGITMGYDTKGITVSREIKRWSMRHGIKAY